MAADMAHQDHWNHVYEAKQSDEVSWFQTTPSSSLRLFELAGLNPASCVIDVGGGDSRLVDALIDRRLTCVNVLDISAAAIARAQARLGERASMVKWIVADVAGDWSPPLVDVWHDRAVFHFLIDATDRERYIGKLRMAVKRGGHAIIATFAPDGPTKCSGLPVMRYSSDTLMQELDPGFHLLHARVEPHTTPMGTTQSFLFALFQKDE